MFPPEMRVFKVLKTNFLWTTKCHC